jgi:hypothetical protein
MARWRGVALVALVLLPGCTQVDRLAGAGPRPVVEEATPEDRELTVQGSGSGSFTVVCATPEVARAIDAVWRHATPDGTTGVPAIHHVASGETSTWNATFEEPGDHLVWAVCTNEAGRAPAVIWNVTVEGDAAEDERSANGTLGTPEPARGTRLPRRDDRAPVRPANQRGRPPMSPVAGRSRATTSLGRRRTRGPVARATPTARAVDPRTRATPSAA